MTIQRFHWRKWGFAATLAGLLVGCGGAPEPTPGEVISANIYVAPTVIPADSKLLVHWMKGTSGAMVRASSILFVPRGTAPVGGWPLVAWVHATTTVGTGEPIANECAPSASPLLDGGLTADGFPSGYNDHIAALVGAGYAVVAPDLEGLGAIAQSDGTPYPYYNLSSSGRSVAAAVVAAHNAGVSISKSWASVGHSEGGHAVMALETSAGDASAYDYKGAVAFAPFNFIQDSVSALGAAAIADPANLVGYRTVQELFVGMFSTALKTQKADFNPAQVMGADLLAIMPSFKSKCIFKMVAEVGTALVNKTPAGFAGFTAQWADHTAMRAFLQTNDLAVAPGFAINKPTLVLQGNVDVFVLEPLQTGFMGRLRTAGMPVTYTTFPTADHGSIIVQGRAAMLQFLTDNLR